MLKSVQRQRHPVPKVDKAIWKVILFAMMKALDKSQHPSKKLSEALFVATTTPDWHRLIRLWLTVVVDMNIWIWIPARNYFIRKKSCTSKLNQFLSGLAKKRPATAAPCSESWQGNMKSYIICHDESSWQISTSIQKVVWGFICCDNNSGLTPINSSFPLSICT